MNPSLNETLKIEHDKITVLVVVTGIRKEGDKKIFILSPENCFDYIYLMTRMGKWQS